MIAAMGRGDRMGRAADHLYIVATLIFMVYSQLILRWQVSGAGQLPPDAMGKVAFIAALLINPWVITAILATFLSGVSWMLAMTKFEIGYAYPFFSLAYVIVLAASVLLFRESLSTSRIVGTLLVFTGIVVIARG